MHARDHSALACSALAVVALSLRVYELGQQSLWLDEAVAVEIASRSLVDVAGGEPTNPPLYFLALHFWMQVFGSGEAAIRWLSVWPSVAAVPLTFILARRLYDPLVAALSAALMAFSPYQIYYAQEARTFALLLFLCLCSTFLFYLTVARPASRQSLAVWLLYCVLTVAALHAHFHAVFVVVAQNVFFIAYWSRHRGLLRNWLIAQTLVLVAFTPWLLAMLRAAGAGGQIRRYLPLKLPQAVMSLLVGDSLVPFDEAAILSARDTVISHAPLIVAFAIGFGVCVVYASRLLSVRPHSTVFTMVMCFVPLLLPFFVSFKVVVFDRRYVIATSPFLCILVAAGAVSVHRLALTGDRRAMVGWTVAAPLVIGLLGLSLNNYYYSPRFGKEQWRDVVGFVEGASRPGDRAVLEPSYLQPAYAYYARSDLPRLGIPVDQEGISGEELDAILIELAPARRVWLIQSHRYSEATLPRLRQRFPEVSHWAFSHAKGIDVYLLER